MPSFPVTTGMLSEYLCLDGSGTTVADSSGNGRNLTFGLAGNHAYDPTWVAGKGVRFNGNQAMQSADGSPIATANTIQAWFTFAPGRAAMQHLVSSQIYGGWALEALSCCPMAAGDYVPNLLYDSGEALIGGGVGVTWVNSPISAGGGKIYVNGTEVAYFRSPTAVPPDPSTWTKMTVGAIAATGTYGLAGDLYALLTYSGSLTSGQVASNEAYWSGTVAPARSITYSLTRAAGSGRPMLGWCGDSRTRGVGSDSSTCLPTQAAALIAGQSYVHRNYGSSGSTSAGFSSTLLSQVTALRATEGSGRDVAFVWFGVNSNYSPQSFLDLVTLCASLKSAGYRRVVVATELPKSGGVEADRATYNTSIRTQPNPPWDAIADFAADSIMGDPANLTNTTYYADQLHPAAGGVARLAVIAAGRVNALRFASGTLGMLGVGS